ncbi:M20 family peptidase [Luteithermobacter gelatinilyticus]|uniref:M20 family peptidase n=1 Tax=Luteithermobacter gelatinilyticus TaxID=2582913 RepID=UPI0011058B4C|nr:M20 family peptidase [Luteithermobacter gelatinilyticus]
MKKGIYVVTGGLALLAAYLVLPVSFLAPPEVPSSETAPPSPVAALDRDAALTRLSRAISFRTVSPQNPEDFDPVPFRELHSFLEHSFPLVHRNLRKQVFNEHSLLYTWVGRNPDLKPALLMNHLDVVPVLYPDRWTHPPFSGVMAEGYIWGRGTLDDKGGVMAILEAAEHLLQQGFQPERTIYFLFGHDEEVGSPEGGAATIGRHLQEQGIRLDFVLDEGMVISDGLLPDLSLPVALIGIAEKGYLDLKLTAHGPGGHSSMPKHNTSIERLSRALTRLYDTPLPQHMDYIEKLADNLKYYMPFGRKLAFHHFDLLEGILKVALSNNETLSPFMRTTTAPTILRAGEKSNVIPAQASAIINFRIIPGETSDDVVERVRNVIDDPQITIEKQDFIDPSPVSDTNSAAFHAIRDSILETAGSEQMATTPQLVTAATDSRFLTQVADNIYRFQYVHMTPELLSGYHGINERLPVRDYFSMIEFYARLMQKVGR